MTESEIPDWMCYSHDRQYGRLPEGSELLPAVVVVHMYCCSPASVVVSAAVLYAWHVRGGI